eukprot:COSAG04_NODE_2483_length_4038_cov_1.761107_4_plen_189_part_01
MVRACRCAGYHQHEEVDALGERGVVVLHEGVVADRAHRHVHRQLRPRHRPPQRRPELADERGHGRAEAGVGLLDIDISAVCLVALDVGDDALHQRGAVGGVGQRRLPAPNRRVLRHRADDHPRAVAVGFTEELRVNRAVGEDVDRGDDVPVVLAPGGGGVVEVGVVAGVLHRRVPVEHVCLPAAVARLQ